MMQVTRFLHDDDVDECGNLSALRLLQELKKCKFERRRHRQRLVFRRDVTKPYRHLLTFN